MVPILLTGKKVTLRPMRPDEVDMFYQWAIDSGPDAFWYGGLYGDPVPNREGFAREWPKHYFDGSAPEQGRSFVIAAEGRPIGQINYNEINRTDNSVDLDILIANDSDRGKGYGTDALETLTKWLFNQMGIAICWLDVNSMNKRAIVAYEKSGFKKQDSQIYYRMKLEKQTTHS